MSDDEKSPFEAFVGIDFGTDGSGLAYALRDGSSYIHNMWDDVSATQKPKTSVLFDNQNNVLSVGNGAQDLYLGCKNDRGWKLFERFKMNLYEEPSNRQIVKDALYKTNFVELKEEIVSTNNKAIRESSSKVFIAQLQYLKEQAFNFIDTHLRRKLNLRGDTDNGWPQVQYFLTVPAIWSDKAKDQMVEWAIAAGLIDGKIPNQLKVVYEPDCASLSIQNAIIRSMKGQNKTDNNAASEQPGSAKKKKKKKKKKGLEALQPQIDINVPFQKGEKYILLDVGGGTCDVAAHEIMGPLAIAEVFHPSGGKWGATYIDNQFIKLISELFTKDLVDIFQMDAMKGRQSYLKFLKYFLNDAKVSYYDEGENPKYHDIEMPENFVTFIITQFITKFKEGSDTLDVANGLRDLNVRLETMSRKYKKYDMSAAQQSNASNIVANPTDDEGGADSDNDDDNDKEDKFKDRNWMIKVIEAEDDDDHEYEEIYLLSMHNDVWEYLFDHIIKPIIKHCKKILDKPQMKDCKYIFLVGGFANSKYFQKKMRFAFSSFNNLSVVVPGLPGLCVVDGAARYGLNQSFVKIRRMPRSYGISSGAAKSTLDVKQYSADFMKQNTYYNKDKKEERVHGIFATFVRLGDAVKIDDTPIVKNFHKSSKNQRNAKISIYSSYEKNPKTVNDEKKLGSFTIDLPTTSDFEGCDVEFIFSTNLLSVYAYPVGKPQKRKRCRVEYL